MQAIDPLKIYEGPHELPRPWNFAVVDLGNGSWEFTMHGITESYTWDALLAAVAMLAVASRGPRDDYSGDYGSEWAYALTLITELLVDNADKCDGAPCIQIGTEVAWKKEGGARA